MQSLVLRKAVADDLSFIEAITNAAYQEYIPLILRQPQPMITNHLEFIEQHDVWILVLDQQAAGILELVPEPAGLLIYSVAVAPEWQKRGFGKKLLQFAEQRARDLDLKTIRLYTNALFERNIELYRRLGYIETKREPMLNSTAVHMAKTI